MDIKEGHLTVDGVKILTVPQFIDARGSLSVAEAVHDIPFEIKRLFWLYDIPTGKMRAGHAHKICQQAIIPLTGSFDLYLSDGSNSMTIHMNNPTKVVCISAGIWCDLKNFSSGTTVMVATSEYFDKEDYLQPYEEFKEWKKENV